MELKIHEQNAPLLYMKIYIPQTPRARVGKTIGSKVRRHLKSHQGKMKCDRWYPG